MPSSSSNRASARQRRTALCAELASIGEFRPGSLQSRYRRCGKPTCHCARPDDPGHGPKWVLTRTVDGGRRNWSIPDEAIEDTQAQVAEYRRFRQLIRELTEVSEQVCQDRLEDRREAAGVAKRGALRRPSRPRSGRKPTA